MSGRRAVITAAGIFVLLACTPATTRPPFQPFPEAMRAELRLRVPLATRRLAEALTADSIPVSIVRERDGYLETGWFDAATLQPTKRRPLGVDVVRVRGWIDPERAGHSTIAVEVTYHGVADPSLDGRELDVSVPNSHPVAVRVGTVVQRVANAAGGKRIAFPDAEPPRPRARQDPTAAPEDSLPMPEPMPGDTSAPGDTIPQP